MRKYISFIISCCLFISCSDFLDRPPISTMYDDNFWNSENSVRTFANGFYALFPGFGNGSVSGDFYFKNMDDNMLNASGPALLTSTVPTSSGNWDFAYVRKANILLSRLDQVPMSDEAKRHWKGFAQLFRAWEYATKVKLYGDIPWYDTYYEEDDPALYKPRDPRAFVMDKVLADFKDAIANLRDNDGVNRINKDVARAMMSRVCLFEGTYRKYRGLPDYQKFLEAARDGASEIITSGKYSLNAEYRSTYTNIDLSKSKEAILYKDYVVNVLMHPTMGYLVSSTVINGLNKYAVESYLCTDGLPITISPLYQGDESIQTVLANRDNRLSATIDTSYAYNGTPFQGTTSSSGYKIIKFVCNEMPSANRIAPYNYSDAPIFWLAEVYLNFVEAKAELGTLTQADLDLTTNRLRSRAGVQPLVLTSIPTDPKRDSSVTPLIWEVRRERQIELMYDGFRQWDLYRWKKGDYLTVSSTVNKDKLTGAKVPDNGKVKRNAEGYIFLSGTRTFGERNYLEPVPSGQFPLYPEGVLKQNPGWE